MFIFKDKLPYDDFGGTLSMSLEFNDILLYTDANGKVKIDVIYEDDTFWLSQKKMAELFAVSVPTINEHLQNIFLISNQNTE